MYILSGLFNKFKHLIVKYLARPSKYNIYYIFSNFLLIYSYIFFSSIRRRKIIIFDISELGYIEHIKSYIEIINTIRNCDLYIVSKDMYLKNPRLLTLGKTIFPIRFLKFLFFTDLFITPHMNSKKPPGSYSIHVFHNQPIKYLSYPLECLKEIDEHFVWGPLMHEWIDNMLKFHSLNTKITPIGNPRIDNFFKNYTNHKPDEFKNKIRIGYAPSWDEGLSLSVDGLNIIKYISNIESSQLFLRLHPCSLISPLHDEYTFYTGNKNWIKSIEELELENLELSHNISTIEYLSNIDLLITDLSSISLEAFLFDLPVIFYHTSQFWSSYYSGEYRNYCLNNTNNAIELKNNDYINGGRIGGIVVDQIPELVDTINNIKNSSDKSNERRKIFKNKLVYNQGISSTFVKKRINSLLFSMTINS